MRWTVAVGARDGGTMVRWYGGAVVLLWYGDMVGGGTALGWQGGTVAQWCRCTGCEGKTEVVGFRGEVERAI